MNRTHGKRQFLARSTGTLERRRERETKDRGAVLEEVREGGLHEDIVSVLYYLETTTRLWTHSGLLADGRSSTKVNRTEDYFTFALFVAAYLPQLSVVPQISRKSDA